ncbi:MAG: hypothetical protein ABH885_07120, partial [Candidatus Omnitrophota bacterium]
MAFIPRAKARGFLLGIKVLCVLLVAALILNDAAFAADEIRSCLAVPGLFNACSVNVDKAAGLYEIRIDPLAKHQKSAAYFLRVIIASALCKGIDAADTVTLIDLMLRQEYEGAGLDPLDWRNLRREGSEFVLPVSGQDVEYRFSRNMGNARGAELVPVGGGQAVAVREVKCYTRIESDEDAKNLIRQIYRGRGRACPAGDVTSVVITNKDGSDIFLIRLT